MQNLAIAADFRGFVAGGDLAHRAPGERAWMACATISFGQAGYAQVVASDFMEINRAVSRSIAEQRGR